MLDFLHFDQYIQRIQDGFPIFLHTHWIDVHPKNGFRLASQ